MTSLTPQDLLEPITKEQLIEWLVEELTFRRSDVQDIYRAPTSLSVIFTGPDKTKRNLVITVSQ